MWHSKKHLTDQGFALPLTMLFAFLLLATTMLTIVMMRAPLHLSSALQDKATTLQGADSAIEIGKAVLADWLKNQQADGTTASFTKLLMASQANNHFLTADDTVYAQLPLTDNVSYSLQVYNNANDPVLAEEKNLNDSDRLIRLVATATENTGSTSKIEAYVKAADSCWHGDANGFCLPQIPASGVMCNINTSEQNLKFKKQLLWLQTYATASGLDHQVLPDWQCQTALANTALPLWQKMQECIPTKGGNSGITKDVRAMVHGDVMKFNKITAKTAQFVGAPEPLAQIDAMNCGALQSFAASLYNLPSDSPKLQRFNKKIITKDTFLGDRDNPMVTIIDSPKGAVYFKKGFRGAGILIIHGNADFKKFPTTTANFRKGGYFEGLIFVFGKTNFTAARLGNSVVVNGAVVMLSGEPVELAEDALQEDPDDEPADNDPDDVENDSDYDSTSDLSELTAINKQENIRLFPHAGLYFSTTALNNAARAASGLVPAQWNSPGDKVETISWREIK